MSDQISQLSTISSTKSYNNILTIIPVYNEEETIASVIASLKQYNLTKIRIIDNGSTDKSANIAKSAGAEVIFEPILGYGQACWRGLQELPPEIEWILFCDGDGSDDLSQLPEFLAQRDNYDFIVGNRTATVAGRNAMTPVQRFGNKLSTLLIYLGWQYQYHDLGPLRLIHRNAIEAMEMNDRNFGWTVEMQVKAIESNLQILEIPVDYHQRQGGKSKISGTIQGTIKAATIILKTIGYLYWRKILNQFLKPKKILLILSTFLLVMGAFLSFPYGDFTIAGMVPQFWKGIAVMSLGFILSWKLPSLTGIWFWSVAIITRLILLPMEPGEDIWRYLWEGYIQNQGFSPYDFPPIAPELESIRPEWWSKILHPTISAIYPPITQFGFRAIAAISPSVILFKIGFIIADLLICWQLSRKLGYLKSTLYAWNPVVIYSFAGGAHYDSWFILPLVGAWLVFDYEENPSRWLISALLLGISIAVKWITLPILGFLAWQAWQKEGFKKAVLVGICGILPLILTAIPFCYSGECQLIPTNSAFVVYGRSADLFPYLLALVWEESRQANWYYLVPLSLAILLLLWKTKTFQSFSSNFLFALLTLSPIIHLWYFTWLMPFATVTRNLGARLVSISAFIYFILPHRMSLGINDWLLSPIERLFLWLPFVLGWFWTIFKENHNVLDTSKDVTS